MNDPIVIDSLNKTYGKFKALDNVSFTIKKNSFTGLLGPNGAGKSTLLKIAVNLAVPTSGSVYIDDTDVTKNPKKALKQTGVLVETIEFYPYLTPRKIFRTIGELYGMKKESINSQTEEILSKMKMSEWADKKMGTFSKGMKQRIAIGQTLINSPSIIILDEPTSGLDPRGIAEVRDFLTELKSEDLTVLISSHNLHEVSGLCDSAAIINKGKLLKNGALTELTQISCRMISVKTNRKVSSGFLESILGMKNVISADCFDNIIQIKMSGGFNEQINLLKEISDSGIDVLQVSEAEGLETAYLDLIKESG